MFRFADTIAILGVVALAIVGGYLKVLPDKLVTALVMGAVGYLGALTWATKRDAKAAKKELEADKREDGAPDDRPDLIEESGKIVVDPQADGRVVKVDTSGRVTIGPAFQPKPEHNEPEPFSETNDDKTPSDEQPLKTGTDEE